MPDTNPRADGPDTKGVFWQALVDRDTAFDGIFVYAVKTTRIFCRPSCPSRQPRPENVVFFSSGTLAEQAGYRGCKRCQTDTAGEAKKPTAGLIQIARRLLTEPEHSASLSALSTASGLSPTQLQRQFKNAFGVSPRSFQQHARLLHLRGMLKTGASVTSAQHASGFTSSSRLQACVDGPLGMPPSRYRVGGAGESIHYAFAETPLGLMLMAASSRGVCFVQFDDDRDRLLGALQAEFPKAKLIASNATDSTELESWLVALNDHLEQHGPCPELPLDLRGTAFQMSVWNFLQAIPSGKTISYTELAAGIERPKAVRAAASACASNRIAVLIPCHRVLRGDGQLGGYRWGLERKKQLLIDEGRLEV